MSGVPENPIVDTKITNLLLLVSLNTTVSRDDDKLIQSGEPYQRDLNLEWIYTAEIYRSYGLSE